MPPDELYKRPAGARKFMLASMAVALEEEARALKAKVLKGGPVSG